MPELDPVMLAHQRADRCYFCHKPKPPGTICECRRPWPGEIIVNHGDGTTAYYYPKALGNARMMVAYYQQERGKRAVRIDGPPLY